MKQLFSVAAVASGALLGLLGLLFLIGSAGQPRRLAVAGVALAMGAGLVWLGMRASRAARRVSAAVIVPELVVLARHGSGVITEADIVASLGERSPRALELLHEMLRRGDCRRDRRDGVPVYVFPEFETRILLRRCSFCGFEVPLAGGPNIDTCPQCGGTYETREGAVDDGGAYRMD